MLAVSKSTEVALISPSTFRALTCRSTVCELIATPSLLSTKLEPPLPLDTSRLILSTVWVIRLWASVSSIFPATVVCNWLTVWVMVLYSPSTFSTRVDRLLAVSSRLATLPFTSPISLWIPVISTSSL